MPVTVMVICDVAAGSLASRKVSMAVRVARVTSTARASARVTIWTSILQGSLPPVRLTRSPPGGEAWPSRGTDSADRSHCATSGLRKATPGRHPLHRPGKCLRQSGLRLLVHPSRPFSVGGGRNLTCQCVIAAGRMAGGDVAGRCFIADRRVVQIRDADVDSADVQQGGQIGLNVLS